MLEQVERVQTVLSGEKYVTASLVLPSMVKLLTKLEELHEQPRFQAADVPLKFVKHLIRNVSRRVVEAARQDDHLMLATILDPRFKDLAFLQRQARACVYAAPLTASLL